MDKAKHTPGPWHIGDIDPPDDLSGSASINAFAWCGLATVVVRMQGESVNCKTGEANARLIAAAPDLVEALKALRLQALQSTVNDPSNEWGSEALQMANAALSKALGEDNP